MTCGIHAKATATLTDARYIHYSIDSVHYGNPGGTADYGGNKSAGIPGTVYSLLIRYLPRQIKSVFAEISLNGSGGYFADDANSALIPSYSVVKGTAGFSAMSLWQDGPTLRGSISVENLFNKKFAASAFINPDRSSATGEFIYLEPGLPQNWVLNVGITWRL